MYLRLVHCYLLFLIATCCYIYVYILTAIRSNELNITFICRYCGLVVGDAIVGCARISVLRIFGRALLLYVIRVHE